MAFEFRGMGMITLDLWRSESKLILISLVYGACAVGELAKQVTNVCYTMNRLIKRQKLLKAVNEGMKEIDIKK